MRNSMVRHLCEVSQKSILMFAMVIVFCGDGNADVRRACKPSKVIEKFEHRGASLKMVMSFESQEHLCTFKQRSFDKMLPDYITIYYKKTEYNIPRRCIKRMQFDLHGIEVRFGPGGVVIWFGSSLRNVGNEKINERDLGAVGIFIDNGKMECYALNEEGAMAPFE